MKTLAKSLLDRLSATCNSFPSQFRGFNALLAIIAVVAYSTRLSRAETLEIYDHATAPCYLYAQTRADSAGVHVTVVTGTVWTQDNSGYFDLRMKDASGNRIGFGFGSGGVIHVSPGTPAGTIVGEFDYVTTYPLCDTPP